MSQQVIWMNRASLSCLPAAIKKRARLTLRATAPIRSNPAGKSDQPRQLPEIPNLPKFSQDASEAEIQPSDLKSPDNQLVSSPTSGVNANALELAPVPGQGAPAVRDSATAATSVAPTLPAPSTIEPAQPSSTTATSGSKDSANHIIEDGASGSSLSPTPSAVMAPATRIAPATMKAAYTETEEPVTAPSIKQPASAAASETQDSALPVPVTSARSTPPVTEKVEDAAPTQIIQTDVVDLSKPTVPPSTAASAGGTEASAEANELPPLPADLSGSRAQRDAVVESAPSPAPESVTPTPTDGLGSELPPLPSDLSQAQIALPKRRHCH